MWKTFRGYFYNKCTQCLQRVFTINRYCLQKVISTIIWALPSNDYLHQCLCARVWSLVRSGEEGEHQGRGSQVWRGRRRRMDAWTRGMMEDQVDLLTLVLVEHLVGMFLRWVDWMGCHWSWGRVLREDEEGRGVWEQVQVWPDDWTDPECCQQRWLVWEKILLIVCKMLLLLFVIRNNFTWTSAGTEAPHLPSSSRFVEVDISHS